MSILADFREDLSRGKQICVMPISRFLIHRPHRIGRFTFYPPGENDVQELRPIPSRQAMTQVVLEDQALRESLTSLTGVTLEALENNTLIAFAIEIDWHSFLNANHRDDISLIRRLSQQAERAMNIIRFWHCNLNQPECLPGRVGSWNGSGQHSCALLFIPGDHESYLIGGPVILASCIVKGMGLEIYEEQGFPDDFCTSPGTAGAVARHGLSLFTDVLESSTETTKFLRTFTLLEFLASPDDFQQMQRAKTEIIAHIAQSKEDYHRLCERFRELTGWKDATGVQRGIRTLLVHHGKFLEDTIANEAERQKLFSGLHGWCFRVLSDMIERSTDPWEQLLEYRSQRRNRLGVG